jgi:hypothetical protein
LWPLPDVGEHEGIRAAIRAMARRSADAPVAEMFADGIGKGVGL